jgi:UDP-GlcNAc:undecaprenyl-phosphate GlcNAc-1-phosphate transferase
MSLPGYLSVTAALAFGITAILIPGIRRLAMGMGGVTEVREDRWSQRPTPIMGGVGIFLGFGLVTLGRTLIPGHPLPEVATGGAGILSISTWQALLLASSLAFFVGLVDDLVHLRPLMKLLGQGAAASILLMAGIGLWLTGIYLVDVLLSLLWFVGVTNALNLLDNMDGLAGGVALVGASFISAIFLLDGSTELAALSLALAGALLGFLMFNYPPAKIFMGDSGSLFLGMLLSGLALSPGPGLSRSLLAIMAVPALILAVPILDTTLVTVSRVLEGRSVAEGGRDHSSHRLVELGMSEERAVWVLWTLAFFGGCVGLLFRTADRTVALFTLGLTVVGLILVGGYLLQARFLQLRKEGMTASVLYDRLHALHARFPVLFLSLDVLLVGVAYFGAYLIRWEQPQLGAELDYFQRSLPVVLVVKLTTFGLLRIYREDFGRFSLGEALRVLRANLIATVFVVAALLMLQRTGLSRGVIAIDFLLISVLTLGSRFSFRIMETWARRWSRAGVGTLLVGRAEDLGLALHEFRRDQWPELRPVALVDRSSGLKRSSLGGLTLFGQESGLARALEATHARAVVFLTREGEDQPIPSGGDDLPQAVMERLELDVYSLRVGLTLSQVHRPPAV